MKSDAKVTIIIPNYNGVDYLEKCLSSLIKQSYRDTSIIIVDNASSDNSIPFLKENYPHLERIELKENTGFSYAVNRGIKQSKSEYVFLLNNDTECDPNCIEHLVALIEKDEKIFSVNSKMVQYNNRDLIDDAGDEYNAFGIAYKRGYNCNVDTNKEIKRVFSCCAGAALYRRSAFDTIGYFDHNFFMYLEDVDIGYRSNVYGYKNYYCPDAVVYHIISGTTGNKKTPFKTMLSARNNTYLLYKNMPILQLVINTPLILFGILIKSIFFSKNKLGMVYFINSFKAIGGFQKLQRPNHHIKYIKSYLTIQLRLWINCFGMIVERIKTKI